MSLASVMARASRAASAAGSLEQVEGDPLGRLGAHARQPTELVDQVLDRRRRRCSRRAARIVVRRPRRPRRRRRRPARRARRPGRARRPWPPRSRPPIDDCCSWAIWSVASCRAASTRSCSSSTSSGSTASGAMVDRLEHHAAGHPDRDRAPAGVALDHRLGRLGLRGRAAAVASPWPARAATPCRSRHRPTRRRRPTRSPRRRTVLRAGRSSGLHRIGGTAWVRPARSRLVDQFSTGEELADPIDRRGGHIGGVGELGQVDVLVGLGRAGGRSSAAPRSPARPRHPRVVVGHGRSSSTVSRSGTGRPKWAASACSTSARRDSHRSAWGALGSANTALPLVTSDEASGPEEGLGPGGEARQDRVAPRQGELVAAGQVARSRLESTPQPLAPVGSASRPRAVAASAATGGLAVGGDGGAAAGAATLPASPVAACLVACRASRAWAAMPGTAGHRPRREQRRCAASAGADGGAAGGAGRGRRGRSRDGARRGAGGAAARRRDDRRARGG